MKKRKIDETLLETKYSFEEYHTHCMSLDDDSEEAEQRFIAWTELYQDSLLTYFNKKLKQGDAMALDLSFPIWLKQMFIRWDANRKLDLKQKEDEENWTTNVMDEINSMLN